MNRSDLKRSALSIGLSLFVVTILLVASPVQAVQLTQSVPASGSTNNQVTLHMYLNVASGENIPLDKVYVQIAGPTPELCIFELDGTPVSGCDDITIIHKESSSPYEAGNREAAGWNGTSNQGTNFGFGYGYGPAAGHQREFVWRLQWDTTSSLPGNYEVKYWVTTSVLDRTYSVEKAAKINLKAKKA